VGGPDAGTCPKASFATSSDETPNFTTGESFHWFAFLLVGH
jgi:hypothetical protein